MSLAKLVAAILYQASLPLGSIHGDDEEGEARCVLLRFVFSND